MTIAALTADVVNILLIVLIVCVFALGIIAVKGFVKERMLRKRSIWFASVLGFLFMVYLIPHVLADLNILAGLHVFSDLRNIFPSDWTQIFLVLGLVTVTGFYVLMAFRQANASMKMVKQNMKPRIIPNFSLVGSIQQDRRVYFQTEIHNDGNGPACGLKVTLEDDSQPPSTIIEMSHLPSVLRSEDYAEWKNPLPYLEFPLSGQIIRRFLKIIYKDIEGEYEICQPFVLRTADNDTPFADLGQISRKQLKRINLEDELP